MTPFAGLFEIVFFLLIVFTGIFTSITDLRHQKIRNAHLIVIVVLAVVFMSVQALSERSWPFLRLQSSFGAAIIAWFFYKNELWRGGDAKLFAVFAILMPATGYESRFFLPSIVLFANTFTIALIFIGGQLLKVLVSDLRVVKEGITDFFAGDRLWRVLASSLGFTWIIFPLLSASGLAQYSFIPFLSLYLAHCFLGSLIFPLIFNRIFIIIILIGGGGLRYMFSPGFFTWKNILVYLYTVVFYSLCAQILNRGTMYISESNERVPFAPFLFLGCLASYTPFLKWIMFLQHLGK